MPIVELTIDSTGALVGAAQYDAAAKSVKNSTDDAIDATNKLRDSLNKLGAVALTALAAAGVAVGAFALKSIKLASDLEETENKYNVVFRGMTETTDKWAEDLQDNYMMTTEASKRFLSSTGDLLKPMGLSTEAAAKMSYQTAKLAADLGSFNNLETADVMDKIQSALVGNYESVKSLGIVMRKTTVEANAYATGIGTVGEELTQAMIAQSALDLIMKGSKDAQGDVARSAGAYANQMKLLRTNIEEFITMVGTALLPAATSIVNQLNVWFESQQNINESMLTAITIVQAFTNGLLGIVMIVGTLTTGLLFLIEMAWKFMNPLNAILIGLEAIGAIDRNPFGDINDFFENMTNSAADATIKAAEFAVVFNNSVEDAKTGIKNSTEEINEALTTTADTVNSTAVPALNNLAETVDKVKEATTSGAMEFYRYKNEAGAWVETLVTAEDKLKLVAEAQKRLTEQQKIGASTTQALNSATERTTQKYYVMVDGVEQLIIVYDEAKTKQDALTASQHGGAAAANTLASANRNAAGAISQVAAASGKASSQSSGSGGSTVVGKTVFPDWFTPAMVQEYNQEYMKYLTNQDYIWNPGIQTGPGGGAAFRDSEGRGVSSRPPSDRNPGNPGDWAMRRGHEGAVGETGEGAISGGVTVNINQQMTAGEVADLITEIERAEDRQ